MGKYFGLNLTLNVLLVYDLNMHFIRINKHKFCKFLNLLNTHFTHSFKDNQL